MSFLANFVIVDAPPPPLLSMYLFFFPQMYAQVNNSELKTHVLYTPRPQARSVAISVFGREYSPFNQEQEGVKRSTDGARRGFRGSINQQKGSRGTKCALVRGNNLIGKWSREVMNQARHLYISYIQPELRISDYRFGQGKGAEPLHREHRESTREHKGSKGEQSESIQTNQALARE